MEFKDIKDVLTFAAFRPEPDNPRFTWAQRFPGRKSVVVGVSRGRCAWACLDRKGQVDSVGEADGEFVEVAAQMADSWKASTEDGWIGLSLNNRFIISLEHNLSRKKGWQEELRLNPKTILGTKYDRTKRYAIHHNPETSASLVMACDDSMVKAAEEAMRSHNLRPARICVGLFAATSHLLDRVAAETSLKSQDLIVATWVDSSLCLVRQKGGQWQDIRCRSGIGPDDEATVAQMLRPFLEKAEPSTRILLMEDRRGGGFSANYLQMLGNHHVTDVTEDHNLWHLLGRH
jgi:hypothetical protein